MDFCYYYKTLNGMMQSEKQKCLLKNIYNFGKYTCINNQVNTVCNLKYLPQYKTIFEDFNLSYKSGDGDTLSNSLKIMQWITDNTRYCGESKLPPSTSDKIIDYSFNKGFDNSINCANKSILLSDALLSVGINAMPVWITNNIIDPKSGYFLHGWCHVVTHVFYTEIKKWIVLDPSFNAFFTEKDIPLNIIDMRDLNREKRKIKIQQYDFNGTQLFIKDYLKFILSGILDISIFPGNDYEYRYDFNCQYHLLPELFFDCLNQIINEVPLSDEYKEHLIWYSNCKKMSVDEFLMPPSFPL